VDLNLNAECQSGLPACSFRRNDLLSSGSAQNCTIGKLNKLYSIISSIEVLFEAPILTSLCMYVRLGLILRNNINCRFLRERYYGEYLDLRKKIAYNGIKFILNFVN
jgi:hypothetical protein